MTPKEKAKELYNKFFYKIPFTNGKCKIEDDGEIEHKASKQCALIAVDELIDSIEIGFEDYKSLAKNSYWLQVKQEIINL